MMSTTMNVTYVRPTRRGAGRPTSNEDRSRDRSGASGASAS